MDNILKCEVVQDLLPLYAEGLTSEVTNEEIDRHLKVCESCTSLWTDIKNDSQLPSASREKKQIKFMKKANRRVWRAVAVTLSCIAVFAGIFLYSCCWGVGVKKDDIIITYHYDERIEDSREFSDVEEIGVKTVKEFNIDITLKSSGGLLARHSFPEQSTGSAKLEYNMRKVNPFMMTFGDIETDAKSFSTGGHYVIDPDDDSGEYLDDYILLKCSDGDIVLTMRDIMEKAQ